AEDSAQIAFWMWSQFWKSCLNEWRSENVPLGLFADYHTDSLCIIKKVCVYLVFFGFEEHQGSVGFMRRCGELETLYLLASEQPDERPQTLGVEIGFICVPCTR